MSTIVELRRGLASLTVLAEREIAPLWREVSTAAAAKSALEDVLPGVLTRYGSAAGALAADWYDERRLQHAVKGSFTAVPVKMTDDGAAALAGWATAPLNAPGADWAAAQTKVAGGLQRRIANVSRLTISDSALADPRADGWQRAGAGECAFCAMLIGRGSVYSEAGADFASHDHCNCVAVPAFGGDERPVKAYTPTGRNITDADRARVREYLATH